jgi:hypothetical protein
VCCCGSASIDMLSRTIRSHSHSTERDVFIRPFWPRRFRSRKPNIERVVVLSYGCHQSSNLQRVCGTHNVPPHVVVRDAKSFCKGQQRPYRRWNTLWIEHDGFSAV